MTYRPIFVAVEPLVTTPPPEIMEGYACTMAFDSVSDETRPFGHSVIFSSWPIDPKIDLGTRDLYVLKCKPVFESSFPYENLDNGQKIRLFAGPYIIGLGIILNPKFPIGQAELKATGADIHDVKSTIATLQHTDHLLDTKRDFFLVSHSRGDGGLK